MSFKNGIVKNSAVENKKFLLILKKQIKKSVIYIINISVLILFLYKILVLFKTLLFF